MIGDSDFQSQITNRPSNHKSPIENRKFLVFSPTDLNHFLECEHLIQLERSRDRSVPRPPRDAHADLLAAKGAEHEAARLAQFCRDGRQVVTVAAPATAPSPSAAALRRPGDWTAEAARTVEAMRAGADVIVPDYRSLDSTLRLLGF